MRKNIDNISKRTVSEHRTTVVQYRASNIRGIESRGSDGSLLATLDCDTAVLDSNPAISPAYSGLPDLRWAAIWDGTSL